MSFPSYVFFMVVYIVVTLCICDGVYILNVGMVVLLDGCSKKCVTAIPSSRGLFRGD